MRTLDLEEEVIVLYALHACGGKGSKHRIIHYILTNDLCKPREGDTRLRGAESKIENDLAWARENLKEKGYLCMPERGVWQITESGRSRLFRIAKAVRERQPGEIEVLLFDRFSGQFLQKLAALGQESSKGTQPTEA